MACRRRLSLSASKQTGSLGRHQCWNWSSGIWNLLPVVFMEPSDGKWNCELLEGGKEESEGPVSIYRSRYTQLISRGHINSLHEVPFYVPNLEPLAQCQGAKYVVTQQIFTDAKRPTEIPFSPTDFSWLTSSALAVQGFCSTQLTSWKWSDLHFYEPQPHTPHLGSATPPEFFPFNQPLCSLPGHSLPLGDDARNGYYINYRYA